MSAFESFAALHVPGDPLVLFNVWDAGSAKAAERAGAKAVATGSASVAAAHGFGDGEGLPLDLALANAGRIANAVSVPVTIDFEGGYSVDPDTVAANVERLCKTGAVGCNFEDQRVGASGAMHGIEEQAARIQAIRWTVGPLFFLNARTDLFLLAPRDAHDSELADAAIERGRAYADAGASGLFVPGLVDLALLERVVKGVALPVNYMAMPAGPSAAEVAATGVARISHGPFPHLLALQAFEDAARAALAG